MNFVDTPQLSMVELHSLLMIVLVKCEDDFYPKWYFDLLISIRQIILDDIVKYYTFENELNCRTLTCIFDGVSKVFALRIPLEREMIDT